MARPVVPQHLEGWAVATIQVGDHLGALWAMVSPEAVASGFLVVCGGIALGLAKAGPEIIKFIGDWRKMMAATRERVEQNGIDVQATKQVVEEVKQQGEQTQKLIELVQKLLSDQNNQVANLRQDHAGLGEAILIGNRDMKDPIRERENP